MSKYIDRVFTKEEINELLAQRAMRDANQRWTKKGEVNVRASPNGGSVRIEIWPDDEAVKGGQR